jgi:hypothetical protein
MQLGEVLRHFICSSVSCLMRIRDGYDKGTASDFVQISEKLRRRPLQQLDKCSRKKHEPHIRFDGMSKLTENEKSEEQIKACSSKEIFHKEFVSGNTNSQFRNYYDIL